MRLTSLLRLPAPSSARFREGLTLLSLTLLCLGLLTPPPACAQWAVQDASGNPIPQNPDGSYGLHGTALNTDSLGGNYPDLNLWAASDPSRSGYAAAESNSPPLNQTAPAYIVSTSIPSIYMNNTIANFVPSPYTRTGETGNFGPSNETITGTMSGTVNGQVLAYWKWTGPLASMPLYVDLLLNTNVGASANANYGTSSLTSGLSATTTATDEVDGEGFNETATASAGGGASGPSTQTITGHHLVRAAVDQTTGRAEVYLNGQETYALSDSLSYGASFPWGYFPTNGMTSAGSNAGVSATVFPITLNLTGTTKDSSGQDNILIGQGCSGSLSTAAPVTFSNYQWSAGGAGFDQFQVASDQSWGHATPVSSDQWQQPNPYWHYLQYDSGPFAVTCSATVNVGGTAIGTVQEQQNVQVWAPYYYMGANVGPCTIVNNVVQAGGVDVQVQPGINFTGRVGTPALFTTSGVRPSVSAGSWAFLQLCKLDESINSSVWPSKTLNTGGYELDNIWPYWGQYIANSTDANPNSASAPDSPAVGLDTTTDNIVINNDFQMYMMYLPPGSNSQWVPLDRLTWHWDVNSSEVGSQWIPTPPGSVIADPDQKWMVHPEWTSRHGNSVATL